MTDPLRSPKVKAWYLDRGAIVYVRQYALADRAATLGWPRDCVAVIDDDLGKSGATVDGPLGFERLLAEVALTASESSWDWRCRDQSLRAWHGEWHQASGATQTLLLPDQGEGSGKGITHRCAFH